MKSLTSFMLLAAMLFSMSVSAQKRVIIIGLDGFGSEGFNASKHPNLDQLLAEGTYSLTTRPVMPSVTLPNWTSHLTGSGPEEHGVTGNDWNYRISLNQLISNRRYYPSIFKILEQVPNVKTGYYYNWADLINSINKRYLDEISFEDHEGYERNYEKAFNFIVANKQDPTLVFLYSVHTDHAGHTYNWMSPEDLQAIEQGDIAIGKLINNLKAANLFNDTHFILITDHGGIEKKHGGVSMHEMQIPWGVTT